MSPRERTLRAMGYRMARRGVWAKPVGGALFTIELTRSHALYSCWFKGADSSLLLWDSDKVEIVDIKTYERALDWIKQAEMWHSRIQSYNSDPGEFEFETVEDAMAEVLG